MSFNSSDVTSQPSVPATPTADNSSTPTTQAYTAPQGATPPATPTGAQPGSQPAATSGAPGEGWVPPHRLRETREQVERQARAYVERLQAEHQAKIAEYENKVRALAGFGPQPDPEVETVKSQIAELFPQLKTLSPEKVEAILQLAERAGDLEQQNDHYWQTYGQRAVDNLYSMAEKDLGQELSQDAKFQLHQSLVGYVQSSPETMRAYTTDPNFIPNFWKAWSSNFIEPARRVAAASAQGRAGLPVPQDIPGQIRTTPMQKPSNLDERLALGWAGYNSSRRP